MTTTLDHTKPQWRHGTTLLRAALVCGLALASQTRAQNALFVQPSELLPGIKAHELLDSGSPDQPGIFNGDSHITVLATPTITLSAAAEIAIHLRYSHKFYHAYERVCPGASGACGEVYAHRVHASGTPALGLGWTMSAVPFVVVQDPQHDDTTFTTYHSFDGGQHKLGETDVAYSKDGSDLRTARSRRPSGTGCGLQRVPGKAPTSW